MSLAKSDKSNDDAVRAVLSDRSFRVAPDGELWREASAGKHAKHNWRWYRCRTLSCYGYYVVRYKFATLFVHRIVYAALVGPLTPGLEINHKNGIKTDNRPENLEEVTAKENVQHAQSIGLRRSAGPWPACERCGEPVGKRENKYCSLKCGTTAYHTRRRAGAAA